MSAVDVLAVIADNAEWARQVAQREDVPVRVRVAAKGVNVSGIEARAAVAELMEATRIACALPTLGNIGRLGDALARCKGEK